MAASTTRKRKANPKTNSKSSKKPQVTEAKLSDSSLKNSPETSFVTLEKPLRKEKTGNAVFPLKQPDIPKVSNNNSTSFTSTTGFPSCPEKSSPESTNPFATHVNIETLTGHTKHKYLKYSSVNPLQFICMQLLIKIKKI